jgi:hypothetical protein
LRRHTFGDSDSDSTDGPTSPKKIKRASKISTVRFFCERCLQDFYAEGPLNHHKQTKCSDKGKQVIQMPIKIDDSPDNDDGKLNEAVTRFKRHDRKFKASIIGFFDVETLMAPVGQATTNPKHPPIFTDPGCDICDRGARCRCPGNARSYTNATAIHRVVSYAYLFINSQGKVILENEGFSRDGTGGEMMLKSLLEDEKILKDILRNPVPLHMSAEDEVKFQQTTACSICEEDFDPQFDKRGNEALPTGCSRVVRDHDHISGEFNGAAHNSCNLTKERTINRIKLFAHNR